MAGKKKVLIFGAGSQGRIVLDILNHYPDEFEVEGFVDLCNNADLRNAVIGGRPVVGTIDNESGSFDNPSFQDKNIHAIVAYGDNKFREKIFNNLQLAGYEVINAIHPTAEIADGVDIGSGVMISAGAVICTGARIGDGVILNTSSSVDHDCILEDFCQIAPGVNLAGNVKIGSRALIGIGSSVVEHTSVGEDATIGAGAAVISNVPAGKKALGVPAKVVNDQ